MIRELYEYFTDSEIQCKCGCGFKELEHGFSKKLLNARKIAKVKFKVNSCCRCKNHNRDVGSTDASDHVTGEGIDIDTPNSYIRFRILYGAVKSGFTRIGIHKDFIHLGDRADNPQEVTWLYKTS
jgi:hypothetical protein